MSWADFYLIGFLVGFALCAISTLMGLHLNIHFHHGHLPALHVPHSHGPYGKGSLVPAINLGTIAAFLAWFGGIGYLLVRYSSVWLWLALIIAMLGGLAGAAAVFWFIAKVLLAREQQLEAADYEVVGVLGRVSSPIRAGGTGEVIYTQQGTRRSRSARSDDGIAIAKGTEVIVTRYEKGIAYVRPWEDLTSPKETL